MTITDPCVASCLRCRGSMWRWSMYVDEYFKPVGGDLLLDEKMGCSVCDVLIRTFRETKQLREAK